MRTVVMDLETTGFKSDIGTLIVACFAELDSTGNLRKMQTRTVNDYEGTVNQREKQLCQWTVDQWQGADVIIGQYHSVFDQKFLQGVMLRHKIQHGILEPRILIDLVMVGRGSFGMSMAMANVLDVLGLGKKDAPNKADWREANHGDDASLRRIAERCKSDVRNTAKIWEEFKPLYFRKRGK